MKRTLEENGNAILELILMKGEKDQLNSRMDFYFREVDSSRPHQFHAWSW